MPDNRGLDASCRGLDGKMLDGRASPWRQWTPRIELRPDCVSVMNEHNLHSRSAPPARPAYPAYVLAVLLLIWQPVTLAFVMSGLLDELSVRGGGLAVILLARLLAAGLGIAAGLALFKRQPGAVTLAKTSLVFSAIVDLVAYATPYMPNNRPPGDATIILIASLIYYCAWFVYLVSLKADTT